MKRKIVGFAPFCCFFCFLFTAHHGYSQDTLSLKKVNPAIEPNGNYKHTIPVSKNHTFKDNFTKPPIDSVHRNYKQQNSNKRSVKFRDHFKSPSQRNHNTYKDPQGI